jgi:CO/xanthine dehydrogenase Mo-binding subunit
VPISQLAARVPGSGTVTEPIEGHGSAAPASIAPSTAAHLAHVRVDRETGEVLVLDYVLAQDVGRAINPALVEGQMHGGITQGLGMALLEELVHDEYGNLVNGALTTYLVPDAASVPRFDTIVVEVPSPDGPFGAKGMAEAPVVGVPAAIANAIARAAGIRPRELPMTPERIWRAARDLKLSQA